MSKLKSYSELIQLKTYEERVMYLMLDGEIGEQTFGEDRYLNQAFYTGRLWRSRRSRIVVRDKGHDIAMPGEEFKIVGSPYVHHINPITKDDILGNRPCLYDPENLITLSKLTHDIITYHLTDRISVAVPERKPGDTKLW